MFSKGITENIAHLCTVLRPKETALDVDFTVGRKIFCAFHTFSMEKCEEKKKKVA